MNPGDRPRRTLLATIGTVVAVAAGVTAVVVTAGSTPAAAGELDRFASCEALAAWGSPGDDTVVLEDVGAAPPADGAIDESSASNAGGAAPATGGDSMATPTVERDPAPASTSAGRPGAGEADDAGAARTSGAAEVEDGTNVIVDGVDELDVVDLLDRDHALVTAARRLSIVDLVDDRVVANLPVPAEVQVTYDRDNEMAWVVGADDRDGRPVVTRVAVTPTSLAVDASWSTSGWLVSARRIGDRLHLVAADGYGHHGIAETSAPRVPFEGGPVPCDEVLHPAAPSDPTATLLVTFRATGPLEPEHATEVVGAGQLVHVTTEAAYLATPLYGPGSVETSIHRFDLATLALTGSGRVGGTLLNEFAMSDHDGYLRVATTDGGGPIAMPVEGDVARPAQGGDRAPARNEVVVLDTDGTLDVVGRTPRFGHPGEALHGIRFAGTTAYAVTFLQTDPFYVLDLRDPRSPRVTGEVELPGFSSYLHPVGEGLVAGFGPDGDGRVAVKLFDVADPTRPAVVDQLDLGDESPVAWDHHAFVDLGEGRFAVPASSYREVRPADCTPARRQALATEAAALEAQLSSHVERPELDAAAQQAVVGLERQLEGIYAEGCLHPVSVPESSVVVVDTAGGRLQLVQRLGAVRTPSSASRAVATDDGWALLAGNRWVVLDGTSGEQVADLELGPDELARPVDLRGGPGGSVVIE